MERINLNRKFAGQKTELPFGEEIRRTYNMAEKKYHELFHDELSKKHYDCKVLDQFAANFTPDSVLCDAGCGPSGHIGRYLFDKGCNISGLIFNPVLVCR
ncbi:hypothetical protein SPTER_07540 [Sporomusa termitida]|uniref:Uncharacterized protein n=1 Tax=Sporomusa termitida TaxID=2377 RepID=A0A517DQ49_9FIRM|nr:hypothetical protein SPTER_07540 [Sporomusa termitida]